MPAQGTTVTSGLPALIRQYLTDNPGEHRTRDIAAGLPAPRGLTRSQWVMKVGNAVAREARNGTIGRVERTLDGWKRPTSLYHALPPSIAAQPTNPEGDA